MSLLLNIILVSSWLIFIGLALIGRLNNAKKANITNDSMPTELVRYKELSFYGQTEIETAYGVLLPLQGIGMNGMTVTGCLVGHDDSKSKNYYPRAVTGTKNITFMWDDFPTYFPQYVEEIKSLNDEEFELRHYAEKEVNQLIREVKSTIDV